MSNAEVPKGPEAPKSTKLGGYLVTVAVLGSSVVSVGFASTLNFFIEHTPAVQFIDVLLYTAPLSLAAVLIAGYWMLTDEPPALPAWSVIIVVATVVSALLGSAAANHALDVRAKRAGVHWLNQR